MLFDARFTITISILVIILGAFNLFMGLTRFRVAQRQNQQSRWYKQIGILTGIEYILVGIVLLMNMGISTGVFPESLAPMVIPIFALVLLLAAAVLALMVWNSIQAARIRKGLRQPSSLPSQSKSNLTSEQKKNRRDRRHNAAAARRRQSGRA